MFIQAFDGYFDSLLFTHEDPFFYPFVTLFIKLNIISTREATATKCSGLLTVPTTPVAVFQEQFCPVVSESAEWFPVVYISPTMLQEDIILYVPIEPTATHTFSNPGIPVLEHFPISIRTHALSILSSCR